MNVASATEVETSVINSLSRLKSHEATMNTNNLSTVNEINKKIFLANSTVLPLNKYNINSPHAFDYMRT